MEQIWLELLKYTENILITMLSHGGDMEDQQGGKHTPESGFK